jgi:ABC-type phosphate transport system substrate-binding protein
MRISNKMYRKKAVLTLIVSSILFPILSLAEIAVIVNKENNSTFDKGTIKKLFLGKAKQFSNGRAAILLNPPADDPIRKEFNEKVLEKTDAQVNAYWSKMMFTGQGIPPQEMKSTSEILSAVQENKDAISYIDASAVTSDVKVVGKF